MASKKKAAPVLLSQKTKQEAKKEVNKIENVSTMVAPYTIDADGNINVTGNITSEQFAQAQSEAKRIRQNKEYQPNTPKNPIDVETVAQVQAREAQTLQNPRKAKVRGRRSLISGSVLGAQGETLG